MSVARFIGMLMRSRERAHVFHLTTPSFAEHKALQAYYEGIVPLVDAYAEAYMGKYGRLGRVTIPRNRTTRRGTPRAYFRLLLTRIRAMKLPRDTYLRNIQDEIVALVRSTLYMLTLK